MTLNEYIEKRKTEIRELEEKHSSTMTAIFHLGGCLELTFLEQAIERGEIDF